jgi:hypothetical protein
MKQDHSAWRSQWYEDELARLAALEEHPQGRTWAHPADVLIAIAAVVVVTLLCLGVFK